MGSNPVGYLNELLGQYEPSTGYQYRKNKLAGEASANAAAGGFRGTGGDTQRHLELINSLMGDDMQQFLANVLGIQQYGQGGQERQHGAGLAGYQAMADRGFNAAGSLADYLGSNLSQQAGMQFQGQAQKNANQAALINSLIGAGSQAFGAYMGRPPTGGGDVGGQMGNAGYQPLQGINWNRGPVGPVSPMNSNMGSYGAAGGRQYGVS